VQIAALSQVGFVARLLHVFLAEPVHFLDSCLKFLLH
jgi:hypothetical protein